MRVAAVGLRNFRAFDRLPPTRFGGIPTLIGANDCGKSCVVYALDVFFGNRPLQGSDFHLNSDDELLEIEVAFSDPPLEISLDAVSLSRLADEGLLDVEGRLHIVKRYSRQSAPDVAAIMLVVHDYHHEDFRNLCSRTEAQLDALAERYQVTTGWQGATPAHKRRLLRHRAQGLGLAQEEIQIEPSQVLWEATEGLLPGFQLFESDEKLVVGQQDFQRQFAFLIEQAVLDPAIADQRKQIEDRIRQEIVTEFEHIHRRLDRYNQALSALVPRLRFDWTQVVRFDLEGRDRQDVQVSLAQRGAGIRRLLMVAFFEHRAERAAQGEGRPFIFAVEEPEAFLHPGAQHSLVTSFRTLAEAGQQVLITTHSPVFAGAVDTEDLILIERARGASTARQAPDLDLDDVARELGVRASDRLLGYHACVFVEGPTDIAILHALADKLKAAGHIEATFTERRIGLVMMGGGDSLQHYMERQAFRALSPRYGVLLDSDRASPGHNIPGKKLRLQAQCQAEGAIFHFTRKRELENYLHPAVIRRRFGQTVTWGEYDDVETSLRGIVSGKDKIAALFDAMTVEEILEQDRYWDRTRRSTHHELLEVIRDFLTLTQTEPGGAND